MHRYFLTLCTDRRSRPFTLIDVVSPVLAQFRQSASLQQFATVAYCFMPDHVHWLCVALSERADLQRFVADAKQRSGYHFARSTGRRLWQRGFYEHVVRDGEQTLAVVRYILANPIRAGLAHTLGEYPFSGSDVFSIEKIAECLQTWSPPSTSHGPTRRQP